MNFSNHFPVLDSYTYLNTANTGILSQQLSQWRVNHEKEYLKTGSYFHQNRGEFLTKGRNMLAEFFNCSPTHTFLIPNFSYGFNTLLRGFDKQERFLLLKNDYPSISYPVRSLGYVFHEMEINENLEQNILTGVEQHKPTVLALSLVQYSDGIKVDLNFIRQLKQDNPELLIIADGTQLCGTLPFDFLSSGIDVLISSGHKWMLAGYGNGFLLVSERATHRIFNDQKKFELPSEGFLKGRNALSLMFEPGHLDTLNFGTLFNSVIHLNNQGMENINSKINSLALSAKK